MPRRKIVDHQKLIKMVQEGKITPEEASKLLSALDGGSRPPGGPPPSDGKNRWFRVRVTDMKTGKKRVNVNIPMGVVELGARMGMRFGERRMPDMGDFDLNEVLSAVRSGAEGKLVEADDEESGDHIEVFVD